MTFLETKQVVLYPAVALALLLAPPLAAGDFSSQTNLGGGFFSASPPCPVKRFPTFEQLVPVPNIIDPFEQDQIPIFCDIQVSRQGEGVKKAKGKFESDLILIDRTAGTVETFPIASGSFQTDRDGRASFDFDLPAEIFADGFESGDVSAWSYTRTDFTNRKRGDNGSAICGSGSSTSN